MLSPIPEIEKEMLAPDSQSVLWLFLAEHIIIQMSVFKSNTLARIN